MIIMIFIIIFLDWMINDTYLITNWVWGPYINLLTKREGCTGRISALHVGLDNWYILSAARSVQKRLRADILPVWSRASLVNKIFKIKP